MLIVCTEDCPNNSHQTSMLLNRLCLFFLTTNSGKALKKYFSVNIFKLLIAHSTEKQRPRVDVLLPFLISVRLLYLL